MEKNCYKWVDINLSSPYVNIAHIIKLIKWTLGQVLFLLGFGPPNHAKTLYMCLYISMLPIYYMDMKIYNFEIWHKLLRSRYGKGREKKMGITWKGYFA
jgi:hypothetical protein